jgi:hypothetical protein
MIILKKLLQLLTRYNNHHKFKFNLVFFLMILMIVEKSTFFIKIINVIFSINLNT